MGENGEIVQFRYADDGIDWTGQQVEPGTAVGILAAQSLSEQITQKSLDSFHHVGETNAMPRLYELFYARDKGVVKAELASRQDALAFAREASTRPILISAHWAIAPDFEAAWVKRWLRIYGSNSAWIGKRAVKLVLDRSAFFFETLRDFCTWLGEPALHSHQKHDPKLEIIVFIEAAQLWPFLARLDPKRGKVSVRVEGCVVEADGLGLLQAGTMLRGVRRKSLTTTNVRDVEKYMGIEAARRSLYEQALRLDAFEGVSPRHLSVLCDAMCSSGRLLATKYNGMGARTTSTLGKTVFQSPVPAFIQAAVLGRKEQFGNVSACLITGERVPLGTGSHFALISDDYHKAEGEWKSPFPLTSWYSPV